MKKITKRILLLKKNVVKKIKQMFEKTIDKFQI